MPINDMANSGHHLPKMYMDSPSSLSPFSKKGGKDPIWQLFCFGLPGFNMAAQTAASRR